MAADDAPVYSDGEIAAIERVPSHEASAMFLRFWTRKEALLKAMGTGLQDNLSCFCTLADGLDQVSVIQVPELPELFDNGEYGWELALRSFEVQDFVGALAVCGPVLSIRRVEWGW